MVFSACSSVVFVMIEIGSSEEKHVRLSSENFAERFADHDKLVKVNGAKRYGNERKAGIHGLQKGKLDFKRMFAFVSDRIFAKHRASMRNLRGEFGVYWHIAERSAPCAFGQDSGFRALGI